ncbi:GNAT family N-acetyltransferase [Devosia sp. Root635]|uniref:GNAT family N-acetyltransferase n=1 Tax=Devosia sp. Root635 TaxID=1736575 RepID=UPI0006FD5C17|nr:GNAT family N-acetyltransferase [Devosia sp. Root635]KRA47909.1 hypothetical protein ASD80_03705 [Devosia sp. Root635]
MSLIVRPAREADVPEMSRLLIASITELCAADHGGRPEQLAAWTANKDEAGVRAMIDNAALCLLVAELDGRLAAVGAVVPANGEVALNYVDPGRRFRGVSKALLAALESELQGHGVIEAQLTSTMTARAFYHAAGWTDDDDRVACQGGSGYRMTKCL